MVQGMKEALRELSVCRIMYAMQMQPGLNLGGGAYHKCGAVPVVCVRIRCEQNELKSGHRSIAWLW